MSERAHERLARHLSVLGMGLPFRDELVDILEANLTVDEAEVALLLPTRVAPLSLATLDEIAAEAGRPAEDLRPVLEGLVDKNLLFTGTTERGERGYGLLQAGFGFPQTFFWSGAQTQHAWNMAGMVAKYFNREVTAEGYGGSETKPYRYIPLDRTMSSDLQAVYPYQTMAAVVEKAQRFAVAHCPCRTALALRGRACEHPLEVCLKFDDMADYLIERGLGREITREEALEIIALSEDLGLVHFVDNAQEGIKHNCNCCGDACWNVGNIRRRKIPRDLLMATYFMRTTDADECIGCGKCAEVCPVQAVTVEDVASVDEEWCIGCGVCVAKCPTGAAGLKLRDDVEKVPPPSFSELHEQILTEKRLK